MARQRWARMHDAPELQEFAENNLRIIRLVSIAFFVSIGVTSSVAYAHGIVSRIDLTITGSALLMLLLISIAAKNQRAVTIASHALVVSLMLFIFSIGFVNSGVSTAPVVAIPFIPALCSKLFRPSISLTYSGLVLLCLALLVFVRPDGFVTAPDTQSSLYATWLGFVVISTTFISLYIVLRNKDLSKTLKYQSERDFLTGLPNRFKIHEYLFREVAKPRREGGCAVVMLIDVDHFKEYNDRNGHTAGDTALVSVANRLRKIADANNGFVGRYGGEEFIFATSVQDPSAIEEVAEQLRLSIQTMKVETAPSHSESLTVTVGLATNYLRPGIDYETLINEADKALYRGKAMGRNQVVLAHPSLSTEHGEERPDSSASKTAPRRVPEGLRVLSSKDRRDFPN